MSIRFGDRPWNRDLRRMADGDVLPDSDGQTDAERFIDDVLRALDTDIATFNDDATAREALLATRLRIARYSGLVGAGRVDPPGPRPYTADDDDIVPL